MLISDSDLRRQICEVGALLYEKGMIAGGEGNISCRLPNGDFLITPAGVCKGNLEPEQVVLLTAAGQARSREQEASTEFRLHLAGYRARPDFQAAVHAHATFLTSFALAGTPIAGERLPEFALLFGGIPLVPYAKPGTSALANALLPLVKDHHTLLLERHGVIAFGESVQEAYFRVEMAEHCAEIIWRSQVLNELENIGPSRSDLKLRTRSPRPGRKSRDEA